MGFTDLSHIVQPCAVLDMLNQLYSRFDALTLRLPVYKVDTVGGEPYHRDHWSSNGLSLHLELAQARTDTAPQ